MNVFQLLEHQLVSMNPAQRLRQGIPWQWWCIYDHGIKDAKWAALEAWKV